MKRDTLPKYTYRKKGVIYFVKRPKGGGQPKWLRMETQFPEGEPIPFAFHAERERLLNAPAPVAPGKDVAAVIRAYRANKKFTRLASRTRKDYDGHLSYFTEKLGHLAPKHIERRHVISWLDKWAAKDTPHKANYRFRVFRRVMEFAIDMGLLPVGGNPATNVSELDYDKTERQPWPVDKVRAFREAATGETLLLFEMMLGLGQRIGDTRQMKWSDYDGTAFTIRQGKTKTKLYLPVPPILKALLDAAPRDALFIFPNGDKTGPLSYRAAHDRIMKVRRAIGAEAYDMHSLRHTKASELAAAGHDDAVIMSITGHKSVSALRVYTEEARQRARAMKAQE